MWISVGGMAKRKEPMPTRILCVETEEVRTPTIHKHVTRVGVGADPEVIEFRMTRQEVVDAMASGQRFETGSHKPDKPSPVVPRVCRAGCPHPTIMAINAIGEEDSIVIPLVDIEQCGEPDE